MDKDHLVRTLRKSGGSAWSEDALKILDISDKLRELALEKFPIEERVHAGMASLFVKKAVEMILNDLSEVSSVRPERIIDLIVEKQGVEFFLEYRETKYRELEQAGKLDGLEF